LGLLWSSPEEHIRVSSSLRLVSADKAKLPVISITPVKLRADVIRSAIRVCNLVENSRCCTSDPIRTGTCEMVELANSQDGVACPPESKASSCNNRSLGSYSDNRCWLSNIPNIKGLRIYNEIEKFPYPFTFKVIEAVVDANRNRTIMLGIVGRNTGELA
jgi:hypothetical protein